MDTPASRTSTHHSSDAHWRAPASSQRSRTHPASSPPSRNDARAESTHPTKLGLRDRVQAVIRAYEVGLVQPGDGPLPPGRRRRAPTSARGWRRTVPTAARRHRRPDRSRVDAMLQRTRPHRRSAIPAGPLAVWFLVVVASVVAAPALFSSLTTDMGGGDELASRPAPTSGSTSCSGSCRRRDPATQRPDRRSSASSTGWPSTTRRPRRPSAGRRPRIAALPGVESVVDAYDRRRPGAAGDRRPGVGGPRHAAVRARRRARRRRRRRPGRARARPAHRRVLVGHEDMVDDEIDAQAEEDLVRGETIALPLAFVALSSCSADCSPPSCRSRWPWPASPGPDHRARRWRRPRATSPCTRSTSSRCSASASASTTASSWSAASGRSAAARAVRVGGDAIDRTVATAGRTVAYSGLTVAVALAGLLVFDSSGLRSLALGGIGVVLVAVRRRRSACCRRCSRSSVTASGPARRARAAACSGTSPTWVRRWAVPVVDRRRRRARRRRRCRSSTPASRTPTPARCRGRRSPASSKRSASASPAVSAEPIEVARDDDAGRSGARRRGSPRSSAATTSPPSTSTTLLAPAGAVVVEVVPDGPTQGEAAQALVGGLRDLDAPFETLVTGDVAELVDLKASIAARLPWALAHRRPGDDGAAVPDDRLGRRRRQGRAS